MIVVNPIDIDESNFQSSTIQEPDLTTGEKEWVNSPFDGYDISSHLTSADGIVKDRASDSYAILNKATKKVHWFNSYFSPTITTTAFLSNYKIYSIGSAPESWGGAVKGGTVLYIANEGLATETIGIQLLDPNEPDLSRLGSSGISNAVDEYMAAGGVFNPIAHSTIDNPSGSGVLVYVLNDNNGSLSVVGLENGPSGSFVFESPVPSPSRTPVAIDCRRGQYGLLFSTSSVTSISFFNSNFTTEQSNNPLTGSNLVNPYVGLTVDGASGYKVINKSNKTVYNISSSYKNGSDYSPGDQVIKAAIHKKYQCLIETTEDPETGVDKVPPTWAELGATNRWAMFSGINTYQSVYDGDVSIQLRPVGITDSVNIFNMENVSSVQVTTSIPDTGDSYTQTYDVSGKYDLVIFDFPPYENPYVDIVFTREPLSTSSMKIGEIVIGESKKLGTLLAGAVSDRIDYSRYTYDEFGNLEYVPRPIVKYNSYPIRIDKIDAPEVELYLDGIQGKLAVWIGDIGDGDYLVARGNLERSPMTYSNPSMIEYLIKVRGSI